MRRTSAGDSYTQFFDRLISVDLLHVDDLGVEKRSDWVLEQLYAVVNERYEMERSMVVTTNLEQPALEEQIGERTVSRLIEICGAAADHRWGRSAISPGSGVLVGPSDHRSHTGPQER